MKVSVMQEYATEIQKMYVILRALQKWIVLQGRERLLTLPNGSSMNSSFLYTQGMREREREGGSRSSGCRHKFFIRLATPIVRVYILWINSTSCVVVTRCQCSRLCVYNKKDHDAFVTSNSRIALFDVTIGRLEVTVCDNCRQCYVNVTL